MRPIRQVSETKTCSSPRSQRSQRSQWSQDTAGSAIPSYSTLMKKAKAGRDTIERLRDKMLGLERAMYVTENKLEELHEVTKKWKN